MAQRGRELFTEAFRTETIVRQIIEVYEEELDRAAQEGASCAELYEVPPFVTLCFLLPPPGTFRKPKPRRQTSL